MLESYFLGISPEGFHRIAYSEWGKSDKASVPIICVHGLTRNRHDFDALADYFSRHDRHLFCLDLVGRGDSDWLNNHLYYTYEQYLTDLTVLIGITKATEIDWIGTSLGGLLGMHLASLPHSPIRRLVLNDIGPQVPVKGLARLSKYVGRDPVFPSLETAKAYFKIIYHDFGHLTEEQWQHLTETSVKEIAPGQFVSKIDQRIKIAPGKIKLDFRTLLHPQKALEGTLFDIDLWATWRRITCPVLVLRGEYSDILLPDTIQKMYHNHPHLKVVEIPATGHAPALYDQAQIDVIYQWLKQ